MKNNTCIYIHWPWCRNLCTHCDYYKFKRIESIDHANIYYGWIRDLTVLEEYFYNKTINSIHIGGGTPSIMKRKLLEKIIIYIYKNYKVNKNAEISIEINPEDINGNKLKSYKEIGINRLSVGVQSFSDTVLKFLGRNHNARQGMLSVLKSSEYFKNISIDLIALKLGSKQKFREQLLFAKDLPIQHISIYDFQYKTLSTELGFVEKNNSIKKYKKILEEKNFFLYEINSFSKKGFKSIYNMSVLDMDDYIGIGPSSHGRVFIKNKFIKLQNLKNFKIWSNKKVDPYKRKVLSKLDSLEDFLLLGLSKSDGVCINKLEKLADYNISKYINMQKISNLKKANLIFEKKGRLALNEKGMNLIYSIISEILVKN